MSDEFYIGYLPKSPPQTGRFTRKVVIALAVAALGTAAILAVTLPYFGNGEFAFGKPAEFSGTIRCEMAPRLSSAGSDYLLVGYGKNRVAPEICGANGSEATLRGTLITREGKQLLEVTTPPQLRGGNTSPSPADIPLGRFTLTGEIVDSKCYFGVMNPAEGRMHRACAVLCLRGGVPAVFVARDQTGATAHLLITGPDGEPMNEQLLRWVGEGVEATGEVLRQGQWLVWRLDPATLRIAGN